MYDLFVVIFLILMVLFIGYHFYIDYTNWSNVGGPFAEGMVNSSHQSSVSSQQIIINMNSKKPTWEEFSRKMQEQTDITYRAYNFAPLFSHLLIKKTSPLSKMVKTVRWNWRGNWHKPMWTGQGATSDAGSNVRLYRKTYELPGFPWNKYNIVLKKPSWETFKKEMIKNPKVMAKPAKNGSAIQILNTSKFSKILPKISGDSNKDYEQLSVKPSTWATKDLVYLYYKTYMLSGFDWLKFPVTPVSTWSSDAPCLPGCKESICIDGNCKATKILGKDFMACGGTCDTLNLDDKSNVCMYDNQCDPGSCGITYFIPTHDPDAPPTAPCNPNQKKWSNDAWDKALGMEKDKMDEIDVNRSICPGIGGPYGCGEDIKKKEDERTIFSEKDTRLVLANKNLIPIGINIRVEDKDTLTRIGKNVMNDVSHIRNVAIPNISDYEYETLGRVIAKIKTDSGAQNEVSTIKLTNSINNILTGRPISNSQLDWGYKIPQKEKKSTTGMYGDNANAMMSNNTELPEGGLCMWSGCERLGKSPYDSIWNLY